MAHIGKYELIEELGRGGYGTVHRVHDPTLGVDRAIKILHPLLNSDPEFMLRFRKEARLVAQLSHPNIVPVIELGQSDGWMYLVMKYMSGKSLRVRLQDGALPYAEAVRVLREVGDGLDYAHEKQVIHRDIKPENILFDERGISYLGDFGFARSLSEASTSTSMSLTGGVLGTPAYMAPEAWEGKGWSRTADLYSLGCVFVEMLSGDVLFAASSPVEAMKKHVIDGPQFPEKWAAELPEGLEAILRKVLSKEAADRFQDVTSFLEAVEDLAVGPGTVAHLVLVPDKSVADRGSIISSTTGKYISDLPASEAEPEVKERLVEKLTRNFLQVPFWVKVSAAGVVILLFFILAWPGDSWIIGLFGTTTPTSLIQIESTNTATGSPIFMNMPTLTIMPVFASPIATTLPETLVLNGHKMVLIPAGDFRMGCDSLHNDDYECDNDELPLHTVFLSDYYIDLYEVTNAQYEDCVSERVCTPPTQSKSFTRDEYFRNPAYSDSPVVFVDWSSAKTYCMWMGGRLPTEAEWEKAARGSTDTRAYPWGDASPTCSLSNFSDCVGDTNAVGSYPSGASAYGVMDMVGNVMEWVNDLYQRDYYTDSPRSDPHGPASVYLNSRVLRGGSWDTSGRFLWLTNRAAFPLNTTNFSIGFRCASSP